MTATETEALMAAIGTRTAATRITRDAHEAVAAAASIGFPVVLRAIGPTILHKTERQAVRLDLRSEDAVRQAALEFQERPMGVIHR